MHTHRPHPGVCVIELVPRRAGLGALLLAGLLLGTLAAAAQPAVANPMLLVLDPLKEETGLKDQPGVTALSQSAHFHHGPVPYAISYHVRTDPKKPGEALWTEGYLGMPGPVSCNWYGGGFLFLSVNGKDVGRTPRSSMGAAETAGRGILDLVWRLDVADVRIRLVGLPGQDFLICEIALEPKQALTSIQLEARCFPSFFTSWFKRTGARRVQTPATLVKEGETRHLPAAGNAWLLYYDEVFDVARGEGEGPCAMLLLPENVTDMVCAPGGYAVSTRLTVAPATRRLRLAFWDFRGKTNAEALARLQRGAADVQRLLAGADFTPAALATFDVAAARKELQEALAQEAVRKLLDKQQLAEAQAWTEQTGALPPAASIAGQEQLLGVAERFGRVIWHVRLARLVAELP